MVLVLVCKCCLPLIVKLPRFWESGNVPLLLQEHGLEYSGVGGTPPSGGGDCSGMGERSANPSCHVWNNYVGFCLNFPRSLRGDPWREVCVLLCARRRRFLRGNRQRDSARVCQALIPVPESHRVACRSDGCRRRWSGWRFLGCLLHRDLHGFLLRLLLYGTTSGIRHLPGAFGRMVTLHALSFLAMISSSFLSISISTRSAISPPPPTQRHYGF